MAFCHSSLLRLVRPMIVDVSNEIKRLKVIVNEDCRSKEKKRTESLLLKEVVEEVKGKFER